MREALIFGSRGPLVCGRMTNAELSAPISGFFRAQNSGNTEGFLDLFTEDAVVSDESHSHRGEAIRTWMDAATANFRPLHVEVVDVVSVDGPTVVTAQVSGTTRHRRHRRDDQLGNRNFSMNFSLPPRQGSFALSVLGQRQQALQCVAVLRTPRMAITSCLSPIPLGPVVLEVVRDLRR